MKAIDANSGSPGAAGLATCEACNWTNVSLLNLGEPGRPFWVCQGCCKKAYVQAGKYQDLVMSVARKFPGETRHETALRYIREMKDRALIGGPCGNSPNTTRSATGEKGQQ